MTEGLSELKGHWCYFHWGHGINMPIKMQVCDVDGHMLKVTDGLWNYSWINTAYIIKITKEIIYSKTKETT